MEFGVFDQLDRRAPAEQEPLSDYYESRLRLIERYDRLGFSHYFVSEHHSTPLGMAASPGIFFSSVAQRTKRLRFGPLVYTLPLYEPYRLIEEICMLDHLSRGRYQLGVGKGISPFEVGYFGIDHAEAQARYIEAMEVILKGLREPVLNHDGAFYQYDDVPMEFAPAQRPHPPLWYGMINPATVAWAAPNNINIVSHVPASLMATIVRDYNEAWDKAHGGSGATKPYTAFGRHVVVAETDDEAFAIAKPAYQAWHACLQFLWIRHGTTSGAHPDTFEEAHERGLIIVGGPERVFEEVSAQIEESGTDLFISRPMFGTITDAQAERSIDLYAEAVMARFNGAAAEPAALGSR
ncbi:MAG: LLM class flavin-dependent oxidoreductase [Alphaproteobacteria bacterium]|nr:LLM class flavin-dependent oxidoreductase [Alphaproteobacteria bacterium]